jgi:hypothetical protein
MIRRTKVLINSVLAKFGYQVQRLPLLLPSGPNPIHIWEDDDVFNDLTRQIVKHTLLDKTACFVLYQLAKQVISSGALGDVAEVGVYKGGTARLLAKIFEPTKKSIHLFDTFSGMPPIDPKRDLYKKRILMMYYLSMLKFSCTTVKMFITTKGCSP